MKYWIDTEFIAKPYTIDLVSVGIVAEDGRDSMRRAARSTGRRPIRGRWRTSPATRRQSDEPRGHQLSPPRVHRSGRAPGFLGLFSGLRLGRVRVAVRGPEECRSIIRSSASTSNNGRSNWAIRSRPQQGARHHALLDARWTKRPGRFWPASIQRGKSDAPSAGSTRKNMPQGAGSLEGRLGDIEGITVFDV